MANVVDQDQQWLLNCLSATLDPNHEVRSFAEASLNQASLQPGSPLFPSQLPFTFKNALRQNPYLVCYLCSNASCFMGCPISLRSFVGLCGMVVAWECTAFEGKCDGFC